MSMMAMMVMWVFALVVWWALSALPMESEIKRRLDYWKKFEQK